ncbi:MAG: Fe-S cluster assembly protein SufD [Bacteroidales bacterium]|nr:Fe-S cluster assembly protein SufD [Bacteroidales bacterium]
METTNTLSELSHQLVDLFTENSELIEKESTDYMNSFRTKALEDFNKFGLPTKKQEAYRYTNLETYFKGEYFPVLSPENFSLNLTDIFKCDIPELDTYVVLVLNGFYYNKNIYHYLPEEVTITGLAQASKNQNGVFNKHYGKYADTSLDGLAALNTLFAQDGVYIHIPKGVELEKPIQIINICYSFKNLRITHRNLIVAEDNSKVNVVVCDHTLCDKSYLSNSVTEIYAGENSYIAYNKIQNENIKSTQLSNTFIHQEANSHVTSNTISLHGGLIRNNVYVTLNAPGCENNTYGLFFADDHQHIANYAEIRHMQPHCHSDQLFKGILDDEATGTFNGKIYVAKDAQKTEAYQRNNNILLSKTAKMNSKPQLEIYADDVKCSHGATMGQLDNDALFYLRTRGINEKEARHLLMYAFANEVISITNVPHLKERIIELVDKRLRGELSRCNNCTIGCT